MNKKTSASPVNVTEPFTVCCCGD